MYAGVAPRMHLPAVKGAFSIRAQPLVLALYGLSRQAALVSVNPIGGHFGDILIMVASSEGRSSSRHHRLPLAAAADVAQVAVKHGDAYRSMVDEGFQQLA